MVSLNGVEFHCYSCKGTLYVSPKLVRSGKRFECCHCGKEQAFNDRGREYLKESLATPGYYPVGRMQNGDPFRTFALFAAAILLATLGALVR